DLQLDPGPDSDAFAPVLCTDGASDSVYAVWYDDRNGDGNDIYASWSRDGGLGWSGAVRLEVDAPGFGDSVSPACVADGDTAHVVWRDQAAPGEGTDIWYRAVVAGIPGGDPVRVDTGRPAGHSNSIAPTVVRDADKLLIGWLDDRGSVEQGIEGYDDLYYNWSEAGRPFGATDARIDSMPDGASYKDDLQLGLIGNRWYAAWTDGREGTKDIWFQSFALGEQGEARPDEPPPGR
ncbi:MAG: hypothetical protein ABMB14_00490, partial [Myxococcota bacterium]